MQAKQGTYVGLSCPRAFPFDKSTSSRSRKQRKRAHMLWPQRAVRSAQRLIHIAGLFSGDELFHLSLSGATGTILSEKRIMEMRYVKTAFHNPIEN